MTTAPRGCPMPPDFDRAALLDALHPLFGERLRPDEPLSRHGTFGVGGPADAFVTVTSEEALLALVRLSREHGWPLMLVGNGTNVLYSDAGARGIVARMAIDDWRLEAVDDSHVC